jgi:Xaa-Pro dipeptidase
MMLDRIKNGAFNFISKNPNATEYDVQRFILQEFKKNKLKTTFTPIVAFNASAANPHYFPKKKSRKLDKDTLILIDIWARFDGERKPYSDITWMGYKGNLSEEMLKVCNIVFLARDRCVAHLRKKLSEKKIPTGYELDAIARRIIEEHGYGKNFIHGTGHSIGYSSPHGQYGRIRKTNNKKLLLNMGYTIEPGIYLKGKFGVRSEIDFYIDSNYNLIITTPVQKKLIKV